MFDGDAGEKIVKETAEHKRLAEISDHGIPWRLWGPYLSERQWGTVREDYSADGNAWDYFTHDQARSRAYRWGEDGIAGISDDRQILCFSLGLWNGSDPILKERLFGLTNSEGNHGEDVKEYYFYLDNTPTHSWMQYLYKYPQAAYPYERLVAENRRRGRQDFEFELIDTGVFDEDRYFDVFVEYAKADPENILIRLTAHNRGPDAAPLHLLPTLWFRNTWSWQEPSVKPSLRSVRTGDGVQIEADHPVLGRKILSCELEHLPTLVVENETNEHRVFGRESGPRFPKDGINERLVHGRDGTVNPDGVGTKGAFHWTAEIPAGGKAVLRLRLRDDKANTPTRDLDAEFDEVLEARRAEANSFFQAVAPTSLSEDEALVYRQALSGMLWSKQYFYFDVRRWTRERGGHAPRNAQWSHMYNADIFSMPDKWEYPWYAAWDLAFHTLALGLVDPAFAKQQLSLNLQEDYLHPNGQMPAYEWNFSDVNPPVHAWATAFLYQLERAQSGHGGDRPWLEQQFDKLLLNFAWWINRKDRSGRNLFEGGFLGLDNIGVFDRSAPLPTGGYLEQADGTAWMAVFSQHMVEIAAELAREEPHYEDMVFRFARQFLEIGFAMLHEGGQGMWDEQAGFFYDVLRHPDGRAERIKVRSMVGLLPLCAATFFAPEFGAKLPQLVARVSWLLEDRPELRSFIHPLDRPGHGGRHLLALVDEAKLRRVLSAMLDENEFLSPHGIRSISRCHAADPYVFQAGGQEYRVGYLPAESDTGMFGGNSNWRGPVWMPVNAMLVRALLVYYAYYGDAFKVECPTGSGQMMNLYEVAKEISRRLASIFLRNSEGRRPVYGGTQKFQVDPNWRDCILFYEYFHGDNGAGLGASHQTGWTGLVATLMHVFSLVSPDAILEGGRGTSFAAMAQSDDERMVSAAGK